MKLYIIIFIIIPSLIIPIGYLLFQKYQHKNVINDFKPNHYIDTQLDSKLLYRLYIPEDIPKNNKIPLILYLHGGGSNGQDNISQIEFGAKKLALNSKKNNSKEAFILCPQCPKGKQWLNTQFKSIPFTNYDQDQIPESNEMKMIIKLIKELIDNNPIDSNKIYVTGASMGGSGTWDIITRYPNFFAAAAPLNGVSDPSKANRISKLPLWAFHGEQDNISDVNNTRNMMNELVKFNTSCKYTEYPQLGHIIEKEVYSNKDFLTWLFNQSRY